MIVPAFPKASETFIVSKFLGLLERGVDAHIVCQSSAEEDWARYSALQGLPEARRRVHITAPVSPLPLCAARFPVVLGKTLAQSMHPSIEYLGMGATGFKNLYLDAEIVRLRPDIVHFEFGALAVGRLHLKKRLGCRIVVSFRGYDLNYSGLENPDHYREVWEDADALHLLGEDLWRRAQRRGCPPDKPHWLIPPAIDAQAFDPGIRSYPETIGTPERPVRLLSVGRLEWIKGYEYALEAVARLISLGIACEYAIVGGGSYLEPVAFARHQMGLKECVTLHGTQPKEAVIQQMRRADIFLHAAVSEGFCNVVMEAQAMGLPVVCTDAGGLPENVAGGETGFVVPRRDPEAMTQRIVELARAPALRRRMGEAGRRRVCERFRLEDQISAFVRMYETLLSGAKGKLS